MAETTRNDYHYRTLDGLRGARACRTSGGGALFGMCVPNEGPSTDMEQETAWSVRGIRLEGMTVSVAFETPPSKNPAHIQYIDEETTIWTEHGDCNARVCILEENRLITHDTGMKILQACLVSKRHLLVVRSRGRRTEALAYDWLEFREKGFSSQPVSVIPDASDFSMLEKEDGRTWMAYQSFEGVWRIILEERSPDLDVLERHIIGDARKYNLAPHLSAEGNTMHVCYRQDNPWGRKDHTFTRESRIRLCRLGGDGVLSDEEIPLPGEMDQKLAFSPVAIHQKDQTRVIYRYFRGIMKSSFNELINDWGWQLFQSIRHRDGSWTRPEVFSYDISYSDDIPCFVDLGGGTNAFLYGSLGFDVNREKTYGYRYQLGCTREAVPGKPYAVPVKGPRDFGGKILPTDKKSIYSHGYHCYFGDLHRHSYLSKCMPEFDGTPTEHMKYAAVAEGYDFYALTDHAYQVSPREWRYLMDVCDSYDLAVPYGLEITDDGHSNFYASDREAALYLYHVFSRTNPLEEAFNRCSKDGFEGRIISIRHFHGDGLAWKHLYDKTHPARWDMRFDHVVEAVQTRGYSKNAVHGILDNGLHAGMTGGSDHSRPKGHPNGGYGIYEKALTGVWAEEISRESLFEALKARRCFSTNGPRMAGHIRVNDKFMGSNGVKGISRFIEMEGFFTTPVKKIHLLRNGEIIRETMGERDSFVDMHEGDAWYQAVMVQEPEEGYEYPGILHTSPVWCKGGE
ncbi:MAG: DUF3604 domain-containing protein [Clostridia bacterium]